MAAKQKVFCIGFMKTGTTTLNRALTRLGYRVSHNSWRWLRPIVRGDWNKIDEQMERWDAVEDNPIPMIYKELDLMYPGSKFILTIRDPKEWYESVAYHIGDLRSPMHEWIFGKGKGLPKDDEQHALRVFNRHIERVKEYFKDRPSDLLIMDVTQTTDWDTLCTFLDEEPPVAAFPHANKSSFNSDKNRGIKRKSKYYKKRIINPLKIAWFRLNNYLPEPTERIN